jgi:hypothetical protein
MAINKISGNILADNLLRGSNLAFQNDLLYIDVANDRVGILTATLSDEFTVNGVANVSNVRVTSATANGIFYANANLLALTDGNFTWDGTTLAVTGNIDGNNVTVVNEISANNVSANTANIGTLNIGNVDISGNLTVGNLTANTSITSLGNIDGANITASGNLAGNNAIITNEVSSATVTATGNVSGGNISTLGNIAGNNISVSNVANITVLNAGSGNLGNLTFADTTISTLLANGNITLEPTGNGLLLIDTVTGVGVPTGNTAQQPSNAVVGTLRFNSDLGFLEVFDGLGWDTIEAGGTTTIINQTINPDGSTITYALDETATAASVLVTMNGVQQTPDIDYSVTGNSITFTDAPLVTDIIQVRFLAGVSSVNYIANATGNAKIQVSGVGNIVLQTSVTDQNIYVTGNILPTSNVAYNLGSNSARWNALWLAGSTLTLGNIVIKNTSANNISFFGADGTTPATLVASNADIAERFSSDQPYPPGTVLIFSGDCQVTHCTSYADSRAAGIVSTAPAYEMNTNLAVTNVTVALAGQIPCLVEGPVSKGDVLTTSNTPGHACRLADQDWRPGVIIGKALESCGTGYHKILVVAQN